MIMIALRNQQKSLSKDSHISKDFTLGINSLFSKDSHISKDSHLTRAHKVSLSH